MFLVRLLDTHTSAVMGVAAIMAGGCMGGARAGGGPGLGAAATGAATGAGAAIADTAGADDGGVWRADERRRICSTTLF